MDVTAMSGSAKSAPLETFLNSVSSRSDAERSGRTQPLAPGSVVILTILDHATTPLKADELWNRSELAADMYWQAVNDLKKRAFIEAANNSYVLTDAGRDAASRERQRLLSF